MTMDPEKCFQARIATLPEALYVLAERCLREDAFVVWVFEYSKPITPENKELLVKLGYGDKANEYGQLAFQELMDGLEKEVSSNRLDEELWWDYLKFRKRWNEDDLEWLANTTAEGPTQWFASILEEGTRLLFQDEDDMGANDTENIDTYAIHAHLRAVAEERVSQQLRTAMCLAPNEGYRERWSYRARHARN